MAVIEVDLDAPPLETPPPVHLYRWAGLALAVVLLLTLGGAAPVASVLFRPAGAIPLGEDGWFRLGGDRVYTSDETSVTAWDLAPVRQLWSTALSAVDPNEDDGQSVSTGGRLTVAGGTVVVQSPEWKTVLLDAATGRVRWRSPIPVEAAPGGVGLVREMIFRPGSEYDRSSGAPGALYLSPSGSAYMEPPQRTVLNGVDLATGRRLWSLPGQGSIFTQAAGELLLVVSADRLALVEPRTGEVLRERVAADQSWSWVVDDTALVRHGGEMVAYDVRTLTPRWRAEADRAGADLAGGLCEGVICRLDPVEIQVLDPATGAVRWRTRPNLSLRRDGDVVIEIDTLSRQPLRAIDAVTGAVRATLRDWQADAIGDVTVLGRPDFVRSGWEFAVVHDGEVRPLGYTRLLVHDCRSSARFLACRTATGLQVFEHGNSSPL